MTEEKGEERKTHLLGDLRNKLKEEAEDRKRWKRHFIHRT